MSAHRVKRWQEPSRLLSFVIEFASLKLIASLAILPVSISSSPLNHNPNSTATAASIVIYIIIIISNLMQVVVRLLVNWPRQLKQKRSSHSNKLETNSPNVRLCSACSFLHPATSVPILEHSEASGAIQLQLHHTSH